MATIELPKPIIYLDKIVRIEWIDSYGGGAWVHIEDYEPNITDVVTYGKCVKNDGDFFTIVSTYSDDQYMAPISIPLVSIKSINIIEGYDE